VENKSEKSKKPLSLPIRILIPVLIVVAIAGIYLIKNKDNTTANVVETAEINEAVETDKVPVLNLHVTEAIDLEELKSYGLPIVIDFGADECIPCKEMAPVLEKLNEELQGKAIILFVDVWQYQDLAIDYPIRVIPTQVLIDSEGNPYTPSDNIDVQLMMYGNKATNEHIFTTHEGGITEEDLLQILYEMGMDK